METRTITCIRLARGAAAASGVELHLCRTATNILTSVAAKLKKRRLAAAAAAALFTKLHVFSCGENALPY